MLYISFLTFFLLHCRFCLGTDDFFLVMASDGIWDKLTNEEVGEIVLNHSCVRRSNGSLTTFSPNFKRTAQQICHQARYDISLIESITNCIILQIWLIYFPLFVNLIFRKFKSKDNLSVVIVDLKNWFHSRRNFSNTKSHNVKVIIIHLIIL